MLIRAHPDHLVIQSHLNMERMWTLFPFIHRRVLIYVREAVDLPLMCSVWHYPGTQGTAVRRVRDQMHLENAVDCISLLDIPSGHEQINSSGRSRSEEVC